MAIKYLKYANDTIWQEPAYHVENRTDIGDHLETMSAGDKLILDFNSPGDVLEAGAPSRHKGMMIMWLVDVNYDDGNSHFIKNVSSSRVTADDYVIINVQIGTICNRLQYDESESVTTYPIKCTNIDTGIIHWESLDDNPSLDVISAPTEHFNMDGYGFYALGLLNFANDDYTSEYGVTNIDYDNDIGYAVIEYSAEE